MIIDHVNLNHLRLFECVYRTGSMTGASQELHLTQSGVSQHMKALEEMIGVRLFDRVKQRLLPTAAADVFYRQCAEGLFDLEKALSDLTGKGRELSGTVSIGMPPEFGNNCIVPLLSDLTEEHPELRMALRYGFASEMNELLLSGEIDFAFVDAFEIDDRITHEAVYDETLYLCVRKDLYRPPTSGRKEDRRYFESLAFVSFLEGEPDLRMWYQHHLGTRHLELNVRVTVHDVQGGARLIVAGAGAGIMPGHLCSKIEKEGHRFHRFKGCGRPLKNTISVAYLRERTRAPATQAVMSELVSALR